MTWTEQEAEARFQVAFDKLDAAIKELEEAREAWRATPRERWGRRIEYIGNGKWAVVKGEGSEAA